MAQIGSSTRISLYSFSWRKLVQVQEYHITRFRDMFRLRGILGRRRVAYLDDATSHTGSTAGFSRHPSMRCYVIQVCHTTSSKYATQSEHVTTARLGRFTHNVESWCPLATDGWKRRRHSQSPMDGMALWLKLAYLAMAMSPNDAAWRSTLLPMTSRNG